MDPLSQGVLGAALPQATHRRNRLLLAGSFGLVAGMAPDLDTLIRSDHDPLLYLEFHRHFTHSLAFVPFGGLICALFLHWLIGRRQSLTFLQTYVFCTLGYATHGLLDAATSYGTLLFWPFSNWRVAGNFISIIDPLFTIPILILVVMSVWQGKAKYARAALAWGVLYITFGVFQYQSAKAAGYEIAKTRGHVAQEMSAKPSFGNLLVWKTIYRHNDTYFVDAVRVGVENSVYPGASIAALDIARDFPWLDKSSQQAQDIERFRHFSDGYLAKAPNGDNRIIDLRYSILPNQITGLWSIALSRDAAIDDHARYLEHRDHAKQDRAQLWHMITGRASGQVLN